MAQKKVNQNPYNMSSGLKDGKTLGDYDTLTGPDEAMLRLRQRTNKKIESGVKRFVSNAKQIPAMVRQIKATNASISLNKKVSKRLSEVRKNKNRK